MASVASQLKEEVTAHAQRDSLEDAREMCADGTYFPNNLRIIASKQNGSEAQTIYDETFYNGLCACFSTEPVKEVPRTDPRHTSLNLIPSHPSRPNSLFTSMLKVMTTLFPWVLKTQEGWGAKEEYRQVSFYATSL